MKFQLVPMSSRYASQIADWHYEGLYAFYDMQQDPEDLAELLNPQSWPEVYYAVLDECAELAGFFAFEPEGKALEIGLGMRPDLTSRGMGVVFVAAGLEFARDHYHPGRFTLRVAAFNLRAIRVYEQCGFRVDGREMQSSNGAMCEFVKMSRDA